MPDEKLAQLRGRLSALARRSLGEVPDYGIFLNERAPYRNRIVTVVYQAADDRPIAFSAMVRLRMVLRKGRSPRTVLHLGLVLVDPDYRGRKIMYWAYHRPLFRFYARRFFRSFWLTSTTMEPVILGSVADSFSRVFPHYRPDAAGPSAYHLAIARTFFRDHGQEIGLWEGASFDERHFVIRDSSLGACRSLMFRFEDAAKYRVEACNDYCRDILHYERGDEFLQVGRVDLKALYRSAWWLVRRLRGWW